MGLSAYREHEHGISQPVALLIFCRSREIKMESRLMGFTDIAYVCSFTCTQPIAIKNFIISH